MNDQRHSRHRSLVSRCDYIVGLRLRTIVYRFLSNLIDLYDTWAGLNNGCAPPRAGEKIQNMEPHGAHGTPPEALGGPLGTHGPPQGTQGPPACGDLL